jgi:hypothetical protein
MSSEPSVAICVVGWHYPEHFYAQLSQFSDAEIFVLSHRSSAAVPASVYRHIQPSRFSFELNLGYDWGCYQQFLQKGEWVKFDYIFFVHDDVIIKSPRFVNRCIELLDAGYSVIGNGRVAPPDQWPKIMPHVYAHASFKPPRNFKHDVVRGSFFATTRRALEKLAAFEVFWDPLHLTSGFGNWSTRATCAKWQHLCGENCFHFLSEEYCESEYLHEFVRGEADGHPTTGDHPIKTLTIWLITRISALYMAIYWQEKAHYWQQFALWILSPLIRLVSGQQVSPALERRFARS